MRAVSSYRCRPSPPPKRFNPSYLSRVLWLTLLAADIVEAILDVRQPPMLQLNQLFKRHLGREKVSGGNVGGGAGTGFQHSLVPFVCRIRIFTEGVAVWRLGDRVIDDRAGITARLRVRECMSTADRVRFVVLVPGDAKCRRHDEPSEHVGAT